MPADYVKLLQPDAFTCCRRHFGVLKASGLKVQAECTRFLDHLVTSNILSVRSKRMEKKPGQKFANTQKSIVLGEEADAVRSGSRSVFFTLQVGTPCSLGSVFQTLTHQNYVGDVQGKSTNTSVRSNDESRPRPHKENASSMGPAAMRTPALSKGGHGTTNGALNIGTAMLNSGACRSAGYT